LRSSQRDTKNRISATIGDTEEASKFLCGEKKYRVISSSLRKQSGNNSRDPMKPEHDDKEFRLSFGLDAQAYARIVRVAELIESQGCDSLCKHKAGSRIAGKQAHTPREDHGLRKVGIHHSQ